MSVWWVSRAGAHSRCAQPGNTLSPEGSAPERAADGVTAFVFLSGVSQVGPVLVTEIGNSLSIPRRITKELLGEVTARCVPDSAEVMISFSAFCGSEGGRVLVQKDSCAHARKSLLRTDARTSRRTHPCVLGLALTPRALPSPGSRSTLRSPGARVGDGIRLSLWNRAVQRERSHSPNPHPVCFRFQGAARPGQAMGRRQTRVCVDVGQGG